MDLLIFNNFSILSILAHFFFWGKNNVLYLCNAFSLFGYVVMILYNPEFFYKKYSYLINPGNAMLFNAVVLGIHLAPLLLQKTDYRFQNDAWIGFNAVVFVYYVFFCCALKSVYPLSHLQLFQLLILFNLILSFLQQSKKNSVIFMGESI